MTRTILSFTLLPVFAASLLTPACATMQDSQGVAFLQTAAQENLAQIALGQLAIQMAESPQVKQFGEKMVQDHQMANQAIRQLATKERVNLPKQLNENQQVKHYELSQLSGKPFDLAYMQYMLEDHKKDVNEFEHTAQRLQDENVQRWAFNALPILRQHLVLASTVATSLGPTYLFSRETHTHR
ncbi:MAG: DUF4142 domain-containing protein [Nitrospira sp. BO4]|jgi:putative membrane protein|nr:DUF4142 domain-containing protein [Nitrospira sp. BO4]